MNSRTTLGKFVIEEQGRAPGATGELSGLIVDLSTALKEISALIARGRLAGALEARANELLLAAVASEPTDAPHPVPGHVARGKYLLVFEPLDGASNLDVNITLGTIFSILRRPEGEVGPDAFLQPGARQICAGFASYGPSTLLVLTTGRGVNGFTLDPSLGEFVLTHPGMTIPEETREFAINASNERFWERPVRRYVEECVAGRAGPREADFSMRWIASLVAEVYRILVRGGVLLHPDRAGGLRLLCEAAPMAFIVEQAGGGATTGRERLLDVAPASPNERVPVFLGSRREVGRLVGYHSEHDEGLDSPYTSPLFNVRSLLRDS